jgi:hypothetical protein
MTTRGAWAVEFLSNIPGVAAYPEGVVAVVAWAESERPYTIAALGPKGNPLDTEWRLLGSTNFNDAGVQNYVNEADGITASVRTILDGFYGGILAALKHQASADAVCAEIAASRWGSNPSPAILLRVRQQWSAISSTPVAGTAVTPIPAPPQPLDPDPIDTGTNHDALIPGYGLPGVPELAVIGHISAPGGVYRGRNVSNGRPVFAVAGSPYRCFKGFNARTLPVGTPLAVMLADLPYVSTVIVTEQL